MISQLACNISDYFVKTNIIEADQRDVIVYGLDIMISALITTVAVFLLSLAYGALIEVALYLVCVIPLRKCGGGYHAKTHWGCTLMQCVVFTAAFFLSKLIVPVTGIISISVFFALAIAVVVLKAPAEHPDNPIDEDKRLPLKRLSMGIALLIAAASIALCVLGFAGYAAMMVTSTAVACCSMVVSSRV